MDRELQLHSDEAALRDLFRHARIAAGYDVYSLALALGEDAPYASKISEAENGVGQRYVQLRWFAPLLASAEALDVIIAFMCGRARKQLPAPIEEMTEEDAEQEALAEVRESEELCEIVKGRIAKRRGVLPSSVPL
jgi:hypothetical protein